MEHIFVLQQLRNMYCHFHQCNDDAQEEVGKDLSDNDRKSSLIRMFGEIFPFLQAEFCLLEKSMAQLMHLFVKYGREIDFFWRVRTDERGNARIRNALSHYLS